MDENGKWDLLGSSLFWETLDKAEVVAIVDLEQGFEEEDEEERVEPARALR